MQKPLQAVLLELTTGCWISRAISVAAKLGVADRLSNGPQSCDTLAQLTESSPTALKRLLRLLASIGLFAEAEDGRFQLTPMAEVLKTDHPGSMRAWATMMGEPWHWSLWGDLLYSVKTGQPAFDHVHGERPFDYFPKHPEAAGIFSEAMTSLSASEIDSILAAYDFSKWRKIVDIAGGNGNLLCPILHKHKETSGLLFDLPHVAESAKKRIEKEGQVGRIEIVGGSFFQSIPSGGDLYLLKHIIHDFDDKESLAIFRNCRQAMAPGAKLLIIEMIIPPGNEASLGKLVDLEMMLIGGVERTEAEYRKLLSESGFKKTAVIPTTSPVSIIESVAE